LTSLLSVRSSFPDPLLTANIYCEGLLDELIRVAIVPFWKNLRGDAPDHLCHLWFIRYRRRGEHLKIRIHGSGGLGPRIRESLAETVSSYFDALGGPRERPTALPANDNPPIDEEDLHPHPHLDRMLLWTNYRRSHVSLGQLPFLSDDAYAGLLTRCLSEACEKAMNAIASADRNEIPLRVRQNTLLKGIISGLAGLSLSCRERTEYLLYHRNWLLRFVLLRNGAEQDKADEALRHFQSQAERISGTLDQLQRIARAQWDVPRSEDSGATDPWPASVHDLSRYVASFRDQSDYRVDPFASDVVFPAVFKALHGFANQLGLSMMDESFTYHIVLRATAPEEAGRAILLAPPREPGHA
jgi:hypothetical protein